MKTKFFLITFTIVSLPILCQAQQKECTIQDSIFSNFSKVKKDSICCQIKKGGAI